MRRALLLAALFGCGWAPTPAGGQSVARAPRVAQAPSAPDTLVPVRRGDTLVLENLSGSLLVRVWERDAVEIVGRGGDEAEVVASRSGARMTVGPGRRDRRRGRDAQLRVPAWLPLEIVGQELEVVVEGTRGGVSVRIVEGDIRVENAEGPLRLSTVDGEIRVRNVRGRVEARSQGDDVWLREVVGDVRVESGSGDLRLEEVDGRVVTAETLDGDVFFSGPVHPGGRYAFSVHDGDAVVAIPSGAAVRASVATFDGDFTSDFPVTIQRYRGGRSFDFTLGGGGADAATLEIQVFDGEIRLVRR